ncbi:IclR family transcriptional regulator [Streptomyces cucumeris]|uniref:IclR family transcriptional regulator n=1 Tax=Streptomyces cucumeris TaxID=2962890 RepID=UPI0020C87E39|nr:IclR family transcriptional regulator [Streptomyces sp. NEAU-Y11]MCP9213449.1 IclR family transcriptional regulator [Streptomyces sp. NEAU-Y11]
MTNKPDARPGDVSGTPLDKALAIVEYVAEVGESAPAQINEQLGISRSATYRLVERLRSAGWLEESPASGTVRLGSHALSVGMLAVGRANILQVAPPYLRRLAQLSQETVNMAVARGDFMAYVAQEEGPAAVKVTAQLGTRRPMNCSALGKAYLAALPEGTLRQRLQSLEYQRLTEHSITDPEQLWQEIQTTRERGYAIDAAEVEPGVACVGAVIRDHRGDPVAAVSVAGPAERMPAKEAEIAPLLIETANDISKRLGYLK